MPDRARLGRSTTDAAGGAHRRRPVGVAATLALITATAGVLGLAGCTGSRPSGSGTPGVESTSVHGAALPSGVVAATAVPTKVANQPALRANVTISTCAAASGGWSAAGTARNPASTSATYTVTVFFTTANATVLGSAASKINVPAHGTQSWKAAAKLTPTNPTRCVLRGVGK